MIHLDVSAPYRQAWKEFSTRMRPLIRELLPDSKLPPLVNAFGRRVPITGTMNFNIKCYETTEDNDLNLVLHMHDFNHDVRVPARTWRHIGNFEIGAPMSLDYEIETVNRRRWLIFQVPRELALKLGWRSDFKIRVELLG